MKKTKLFGLALIATMMGTSFSACGNEAEEVLAQESEIRLTSEITPSSRVTDLGYQSEQIVSGQKVGITITGAASEHKNVEWTVVNGGALTPSTKVYWGNGDANITAYQPYNPSWSANTAYDFSVATNQSINLNYLNSDLLWSQATEPKSAEPVTIIFTHKLAKVNVTLSSSDIEEQDLSTAIISICGTKISTTFNPMTGTIGDATGDAINIKASEGKTASAIIIPQEISEGTKFIKIVISDKIYYYTLSDDTEFKSGNSYSYALNIKGQKLEVNGIASITPWTNNQISGDADINFEEAKNINVSNAGNLHTHISANEKLAISSLTLSGNLNGDDITYINEMINDGSLTNLDMRNASIVAGGTGNLITETNKFGTYIFRTGSKLETITLPKTLTYIEHGFLQCSNLEIIIPAECNFGFGGTPWFFACSNVSFYVEDGNSTYKSVGGVLFNKAGTILLSNCLNIKNYEIPVGVERIFSGAFFSYNDKIETIIIPYTITEIQKDAFSGLVALKEVYSHSSDVPTIAAENNESIFDSNIFEKCTLYVPEESLDDYKAATYWKDFANIKPIE